MLRIAIIGTGRVAMARAKEIVKRPDCQLVAVAGSSLERAHQVAALGQADATVDVLSVLDRADVDAVMICNGNAQHERCVQASIAAGKAVSVDYPLALTASAAQQLVDQARAARVYLHVEHIDLLSPWFQVVSQAVAGLGKVETVTLSEASPRPYDPESWVFSHHSGRTFFKHAAILSRIVSLCGPLRVSTGSEQFSPVADDRFRFRRTEATFVPLAGGSVHIHDELGINPEHLRPNANDQMELQVRCAQGVVQCHNRKFVKLLRFAEDQWKELAVPESTGLFAGDIAMFLSNLQAFQAGDDGPLQQRLHHVLSVMAAAEEFHTLVAASGTGALSQ